VIRLQRAEDDAGAASVVRFVDAASRHGDVLGPPADVHHLSHVVTRLLENGRAGSRFPLLRLVGRAQALSSGECDALVREVVRLRHLLAPFSADELRPAPRAAVSDPGLDGAAPLGPAPDPFPRGGGAPPRTLADAFARPLAVLEHVARLGAASRCGARFEVVRGAPDGRESVAAAPGAVQPAT
jgi:hypothetical protein